ncbi:MAG TPA: molybdopterin molybdotransferase MoeA [Ilumatobacteraceae bacterium]|nr:molybdopterin molybdotransferase MoeA [Ilumatobacteraceae bacterium]
MISDAEALQYVLHHCAPLAATEVSTADAGGRVLAVAVAAAEDVPPFDNSAVDGYAVLANDVRGASPTNPVELRVIDKVAAGSASSATVVSGTAIRIMTGAPMPAGADASVMVEDTIRDDARGTVSIRAAVEPGAAVRRAGDDARHGAEVAPAGTVVTPAVAGVLASVNARTVTVIPAARVAVLSTGDELVDDGSPLRPGQIRESNRTMLLGMVAEAGAVAVDYGIVADDEALLEQTLRRAAAECDAIVTSGGVSMGDFDVVKAVLARIAQMRWMQIAIKPAKPFAFGTLAVSIDAAERHVPVFGLPGNPVSSLVSFELFARPALRQMMGHANLRRPQVAAIADHPLRRRADGKTHFARVVARFADDGRVHVAPVAAQGSHQLVATSMANALAVLVDGDGVDAGGEIPVMVLSIA